MDAPSTTPATSPDTTSAPAVRVAQPVLPVLEYRTADNPAEPSRKLVGAVCSVWAVVMMLQSLLAMARVWDNYSRVIWESERTWLDNELERRIYERDRRAGLPVMKKPPVVYRSIVPPIWAPWGLFALLLMTCGLSVAVGLTARHALLRDGQFATAANRWVRFLLVIPSLFLLVALIGYGGQCFRLMTPGHVLIGWQMIGTLLLATWLRAEVRRNPTADP